MVEVLAIRASGNRMPVDLTLIQWFGLDFPLFILQVGDLASVQKIEKRRLKSIESVKEFQGRETALLIDRYRFLDLFPCSESELRSLGYRVSVLTP